MTDAPARILVHLLHQLRHRAAAVADHVGRYPLGGGDQLAVDHQQAMIEPFQVGLDDDQIAVFLGLVVGCLQLLGVLDVGGDAAAVIGVDGLEHHRVADPLGGLLGATQSAHHRLADPDHRGCGWSRPSRRRAPRRCGASRW